MGDGGEGFLVQIQDVRFQGLDKYRNSPVIGVAVPIDVTGASYRQLDDPVWRLRKVPLRPAFVPTGRHHQGDVHTGLMERQLTQAMRRVPSRVVNP